MIAVNRNLQFFPILAFALRILSPSSMINSTFYYLCKVPTGLPCSFLSEVFLLGEHHTEFYNLMARKIYPIYHLLQYTSRPSITTLPLLQVVPESFPKASHMFDSFLSCSQKPVTCASCSRVLPKSQSHDRVVPESFPKGLRRLKHKVSSLL